MKKLVIIMPHVTGKGGTEKVINSVMRLLQKNNSQFETKLYIIGGSENKEWLKELNYSETVYSNNRLIRNLQNTFSIMIYLKKFLQSEKPDMVVTTHSILCFIINIIRKMTRADYPIISWIHFSLNSRNVKKKLLKNADFHLAISEGIEKQFNSLGIQSSSVYTIYNPIDRKDKLIKRPQTKTVFLYVGRVIFKGQKYIKELLEALSQVKGNWNLEILGDGADLNLCKDYAKQLNISDKVSWRGYVSSPWNEISEATALVLTSKFEGLPMVLAEAISHGVYCISSDCETGPSDIIENNINGELYKPGDVRTLKEILQGIVNGKKLTDQKRIQESINQLYLDQYYKKIEMSLEGIYYNWSYSNQKDMR